MKTCSAKVFKKVLLVMLCLVAASAWPERKAWIENASEFEEKLNQTVPGIKDPFLFD